MDPKRDLEIRLLEDSLRENRMKLIGLHIRYGAPATAQARAEADALIRVVERQILETERRLRRLEADVI